jgi:hypothetical protein
MVAEAVGFMSRAVDGGMAAELVTRDFLGGCAAGDDARDAAARHDAAVVRTDLSLCFRSLRALISSSLRAQLGLDRAG